MGGNMNTNLVTNQVERPLDFEVKMIASEILKKNKLGFRRSKYLLKQAQHFSPFYRDFIIKVITNKSLKIVSDSEGYIEEILKDGESFFSSSKPIVVPKSGEITFDTKLSKKRENKIHTNLKDLSMLPHELGHAVDFMFGRANALSNVVILSNGKTLHQVFTEEFEAEHQYLYEMVMDEYKNIINSNINDDAYDILISHMDEYRLLCNIPINKVKVDIRNRKFLQTKLYECGFVDAYYLLYAKKCYQILNDKYSPILDALSSKYDFNGLNLDHHNMDYYNTCKHRATYEFFANAFMAKVTGKYQYIEHLIKLLPKSFEAFEELFDICYQHITNNKRFTDVKIRQRSNFNDF